MWRVADQAQVRCARCRRAPRFLSRARSAGPYEGTLRAAIHALKYGGRRSLACRLAELMRASGVEILAGADAVVPVPLHRARQLARGFNQSADLARHLHLPVVPALARTRNTAPQADLPAGRRHANVRAAFAATRVEAWQGATLVLVDDVTTTGATLEA